MKGNKIPHINKLKAQLSNESLEAVSPKIQAPPSPLDLPLQPPSSLSPNSQLHELNSVKMKNSSNYFSVIRSNSVPDVDGSENNNSKGIIENLMFNNSQKNSNGSNSNYYFRNPNSIESIAVPSPAGSLEQFDVTTTPLSVDDTSDTSILDSLKETTSCMSTLNREENNIVNSPSLASPSTNFPVKPYDSNSPSFRFRRHSSQSSLHQVSNLNNNSVNPSSIVQGSSTNLISPLTIASVTTNLGGDRSICSSPINSLKMSSRVCQIKIDEGIELHLSREIKSEREMQSTLKLKTSCDELMLNSDEFETFSFDSNNRNNTPSPSLGNSTSNNNSATFRRYRTFSESLNNNATTTNVIGASLNVNMPSPSVSSFHSYSNSSSPTADLINMQNLNGVNNTGGLLLRCFSPSSSNRNGLNINNNGNSGQNYFSKSPSPTRKVLAARRSMSPVPAFTLRPSSLNTNSTCKRKFSDVDQGNSNDSLSTIYSPKRSNNDSQNQHQNNSTNNQSQQQEFVEPLLIFTGNNSNSNTGSSINNQNITRTLNKSTASSPSSPYLSSSISSASNHNNVFLPATSSSSSNQKAFSSLVITAQNNNFYNNATKSLASNTNNSNYGSGETSSTKSKELNNDSSIADKMITNSNVDTENDKKNSEDSPSFAWPKSSSTSLSNNNEQRNKYTFIPIQLPPPTNGDNTSTFSSNNQNQSNSQPTHQIQHKRLAAVLTTSKSSANNQNNSSTSISNTSQINQSSNNNNQIQIQGPINNNNSPLNSPARYFCESPISYSPSVSAVSSSVSVDKPDSGYQSSAQNNSDSESCI